MHTLLAGETFDEVESSRTLNADELVLSAGLPSFTCTGERKMEISESLDVVNPVARTDAME